MKCMIKIGIYFKIAIKLAYFVDSLSLHHGHSQAKPSAYQQIKLKKNKDGKLSRCDHA